MKSGKLIFLQYLEEKRKEYSFLFLITTQDK